MAKFLNSTMGLLCLICILFLMNSCSVSSGRDNTQYQVKVIDSAKIFTPKFVNKAIDTFKFPAGIPVVVFTVKEIADSEIGTFASNKMEELTENSGRKEKQNVVFIVISKIPKLLQIRYGYNLQLEAYHSGIAMGEKYKKYECEIGATDYKKGIISVLQQLNFEIQSATDVPWIYKYQKPEILFFFHHFTEFAEPTEGSYNCFIFKWYSKLMKIFPITEKPIYFILMNALLFFLIKKITLKLLEAVLGASRIGRGINIAITILVSIFVSVPYWAGILFLSGGRYEDIIYLKYLGIPTFKFQQSDWLFHSTSIWLVATIPIVVYLINTPYSIALEAAAKAKINKEPPDYSNSIKEYADRQTDNLDVVISRFIGFVFFIFMMPMSISLLILFSSLMNAPKAFKLYLAFKKA